MACGALVSVLISSCSKSDPSAAATVSSGRAPAASGFATSPVDSASSARVASESPRACALVADDDLKAAFGVVFARRPNPPSGYPTVSMCGYRSGLLSLNVRTEAVGREGYDRAKDLMNGGEEVSNVGEAAYFQPLQNAGAFIGNFVIFKGGTLLTLTYGGIGVDKESVRSSEMVLAARLLPKL